MCEELAAASRLECFQQGSSGRVSLIAGPRVKLPATGFESSLPGLPDRGEALQGEPLLTPEWLAEGADDPLCQGSCRPRRIRALGLAADREARTNTLTVLTRLSQRRPRNRSSLETALHGRVEELAEIVLEVGRGFDVAMAVPFDEPLSEGLRQVARRCAEACPTGALALRSERSCDLGACAGCAVALAGAVDSREAVA